MSNPPAFAPGKPAQGLFPHGATSQFRTRKMVARPGESGEPGTFGRILGNILLIAQDSAKPHRIGAPENKRDSGRMKPAGSLKTLRLACSDVGSGFEHLALCSGECRQAACER